MPHFKILCVAGARPNFMKLAPLFRAFKDNTHLLPILVHTGQHYDDQMSGTFFRDLCLPAPEYNLSVGSATHAQQTADVMKRFEPIALDERPRAVLVVGDVNSTLACALVSAKLNIPVIHVEAGLRSFDRSMPEEINRIVTDAISDLMLVSEESGIGNLRLEGVPMRRMSLVGNLMIDSLYFHLQKAKLSQLPGKLGLTAEPFGVVTLHRPSNVDDPAHLGEIVTALNDIAQTLPLYFAVHPRTRACLRDTVSVSERVCLLEPLGYLDFLALMSRSSLVLTDSGGIQEETTALGIPCLTLRDNTERPATIEEGTNRLAGTTSQSILEAWHCHLQQPKVGRIPALWDGRAAERSITAMKSFFGI